jgi:hypothetical protein
MHARTQGSHGRAPWRDTNRGACACSALCARCHAAQLKNTKYVVGLVIYTGMETKIMMSLPNPPSKRSSVEIVRAPALSWLHAWRIATYL